MFEQRKLRVGWFTFTCCEDSTILMTELMNDHWQDWKKYIDFRHARVLKTKNVLDELDVAFVEGAIASEEQAKKLKEIREKSKKLVAIGSCAVLGMPSAQRNSFDEKTMQEIQPILDKFKQFSKVKKLSEVVKVDIDVPGCPMDPKLFLSVVDSALREFKIIE